MSFRYPLMLAVAAAACIAMLLGYRALHRRRTGALRASQPENGESRQPQRLIAATFPRMRLRHGSRCLR